MDAGSALVGELTADEMDDLEAAAIAAGLDDDMLDLADPVPGMGVSDATTTSITVTVDGVVRTHQIYALGQMGERDLSFPAAGEPGAWAPGKREGRLAVLRFIDHVRAVALRSVHPSSGPDGFTEDELHLMSAAAELGYDAVRAEHPGPRGATLWMPGVSPPVYLGSVTTSASPDVEVIGSRTLRGVEVQSVRSSSGVGTTEQFACGDLTYSLWSESPDPAVPLGFASHDDFVLGLVQALEC
jgi:hypothetical protein